MPERDAFGGKLVEWVLRYCSVFQFTNNLIKGAGDRLTKGQIEDFVERHERALLELPKYLTENTGDELLGTLIRSSSKLLDATLSTAAEVEEIIVRMLVASLEERNFAVETIQKLHDTSEIPFEPKENLIRRRNSLIAATAELPQIEENDLVIEEDWDPILNDHIEWIDNALSLLDDLARTLHEQLDLETR